MSKMKNGAEAEATSKASRWQQNYFSNLYKHRHIFHVFLALTTLLSLVLASHLKLKTDFSELLPDQLTSVKSLQKSLERVGGTGYLIVGVLGPRYENNRKAVEAIAEHLQPMIGKTLRSVEYRYRDVRDFAEKYALHYLSEEDLTKVRDKLKTEIQKRLDSSVGSFLGLDDDDSSTKKASKTDQPLVEQILGSKIDPSIKALMDYRDSYLSADNGKVMALDIRLLGSSLSIHQNQEVIDSVNAILKDINLASIDPQIQTVLAGSVPQAIEEFDTVRHDIVSTSLELVILIVAVLFIFFWSFRLVGLLAANLLVGVAWTFGATQLHIGYLNTQTAFLGSLVAGTGINYGIIFLSRYIELRRSGEQVQKAIEAAIRGTAVPTLIASLSTAVSFATLLLADNKGFSQFGFIGGIGIVFCWIAAFSVLPLWLFMLEKHMPNRRGYQNPLARRFHFLGARIGNGVVRNHKLVLALTFVACVISTMGFKKLANAPLEYDFDKVRNKNSVSSDVEALRQRVYKAFPVSLTPSIAFADTVDQAKDICPTVQQLQHELPPQKNVIASCSSLFSLVPKAPKDPAKAKALMVEIKNLLGHRVLKFSEEGDFAKELSQSIVLKAPTLEDIPAQLKSRFQELNGNQGLFAFIYPDSSKPLNDGRNLLNFTDSLSHLRLRDNQTTVEVAGDSFVLADLLRGIRSEGPALTIIAFFGVIMVAVLLTGGIGAGLYMCICLFVATWWMVGLQGFFDLKYNFFNFIALPLTFGIGVDYPINIFLRCREEKHETYGHIFNTSGMAVLLASLTTIIGYYTLLGASSQALSGFGKLAIIGEITCLLVALILPPVGLHVIRRFREKRERPQDPPPSQATTENSLSIE